MSTTVISTRITGNGPAWAQTMRRWTDYFMQETSMSHYPEWKQYERHTWLLLSLVILG